MKTIKLSDIKIDDSFLKTKSSERKIEKAIRYIKKNGRLDKPIVLNDGVLVDNYARYLAANIIGLHEVPYVELQKLNYIIGKFNRNDKEYIWKNDRDISLEIGDNVLVRVKQKDKYKKACVTVVDIFNSDDLDLYNKHKSILKNTNKH